METIQEPHEPSMTDWNVTPTMVGKRRFDPEEDGRTDLSTQADAARIGLDEDGTKSEEAQEAQTDLVPPVETNETCEPDGTEEDPDDVVARTDLPGPEWA